MQVRGREGIDFILLQVLLKMSGRSVLSMDL